VARICNHCALGVNEINQIPFPARYSQSSGHCNFCDNDCAITIDCSELEEIYYPVFCAYESDEESNLTLIESVSKDWLIAGTSKDQQNLKELLLECMPNHVGDIDFDSRVRLRSCEDDEVNNAERYWYELNRSIREDNRYFPKYRKEIENLFRNMEESGYITYVQLVMLESNQLYRARVSSNCVEYTAKEMGMPPAEKASPGRANSDGIPVLYAATNTTTAIKELRPIQDSIVYVSKIELQEPLNLYAFTDILEKMNPIFLLGNNKFEQFDNDIDLCVWFTHWIRFQRVISKSLSEPIRKRFEDINNYAATQFLCDWIKSEGADGVLFDSAVDSGQNVVLFSEQKVQIGEPRRYQITDVNYKFKRC
jgi:hypothetical protein